MSLLERPEAALLRALEEQRSPKQARAEWLASARGSQLTPPGDWLVWLILAGRGWGKTRTGAEDLAWWGQRHPGARLAVVAPTYADGRDTCIEGESGLLRVIPRASVEAWNRSLGELLLTNGTRFKLFSAEEPERLRGPQHSRAWCDEVAAWKYPETWDQLMFGLRLGPSPQVVATTTPKPTALIRALVKAETTHVTRGSTFENADNLAPAVLAQLRAKYEGTRLGRQELEAEVLEDTPGALWTRKMVEAARTDAAPALRRVVVAVDPSGSDGERGDYQGIVAAGVGYDGRGYVLEDASIRGSPDVWARQVADVYARHKADRVVAEVNFGGAMVESVLRTAAPNLPITLVSASRGKAIRAEPVAALYEQGRVSHVGFFPDLEDQLVAMTSRGFTGPDSPDRLDAMVWAFTDLMLQVAKGQALLDQALEGLAEMRKATVEPEAPTYAPGSVEWAAQQSLAAETVH